MFVYNNILLSHTCNLNMPILYLFISDQHVSLVNTTKNVWLTLQIP